MFSAIYVVAGLETIGNTSGITVAIFDRDATAKEMSGAVVADAVGSMIATVFNTLPNTAYGENAGLVAITKVVNKFCLATGATILVVSGFIPKIGAIFSLMPDSVLGGAVMTVFPMIIVNGVKLISKAGFSQRNVITLSIILAIGMGLADAPEGAYNVLPTALQYLFRDSVATTCMMGIIVNAIFPPDKVEDAVIEV
jgi:NCS2 family nucleobase:cation symporter-2